MNPDELYALVVKAIKDSPPLLIIKGDEAGRRLHFVVVDHVKSRNDYFEFAISHDGKESSVRFTTNNIELQKQLVKVTAYALRSVYVKHFLPPLIHRSGLEEIEP